MGGAFCCCVCLDQTGLETSPTGLRLRGQVGLRRGAKGHPEGAKAAGPGHRQPGQVTGSPAGHAEWAEQQLQGSAELGFLRYHAPRLGLIPPVTPTSSLVSLTFAWQVHGSERDANVGLSGPHLGDVIHRV